MGTRSACKRTPTVCCFSISLVSLSSSLTAPHGLVRSGEKGASPDFTPHPRPTVCRGGVALRRKASGGVEQGGGRPVLCNSHCTTPPSFGPFQLSCHYLPAVYPRSAHVVTLLDPHGASALPLWPSLALDRTPLAHQTPEPPSRAPSSVAPTAPAGLGALLAQALEERRSPASCWNGTLHPMEPRCPSPCPSQAQPRRCFLFYCPGAGGRGSLGTPVQL